MYLKTSDFLRDRFFQLGIFASLIYLWIVVKEKSWMHCRNPKARVSCTYNHTVTLISQHSVKSQTRKNFKVVIHHYIQTFSLLQHLTEKFPFILSMNLVEMTDELNDDIIGVRIFFSFFCDQLNSVISFRISAVWWQNIWTEINTVSAFFLLLLKFLKCSNKIFWRRWAPKPAGISAGLFEKQ